MIELLMVRGTIARVRTAAYRHRPQAGEMLVKGGGARSITLHCGEMLCMEFFPRMCGHGARLLSRSNAPGMEVYTI